MKIFKTFLVVLSLLTYSYTYAWGSTGHRVIAEIAFQNIKKSSKRKILKLLENQNLASISTYADEIKSDERYKNFYTWHYVDFQYGKKYEDCGHNIEGDLILGINKCIEIIKSKEKKPEEKSFYLKLLIHLIGDLHQPLHIGRDSDKGGNDIKVLWFNTPSNLHKIWDEDMINYYMMSYSELATELNHSEQNQKKKIQSGTLMNWVYESQSLAEVVYNKTVINDKLGYKYQYENFSIVKNQLQKGGFRLAKILNELF